MAMPVTFVGTANADISTIGFVKRSGDTGQFLITTGERCRPGSTAASVQYTWGLDIPPDPDYWAEVGFVFLDRSKTQRSGITIRSSIDDRTFYLLRVRYVAFDPNATLELYKAVNNTFTPLDSYSFAVTDGTSGIIRLEAVGTSIRGYLNGTQRVTATDSSITQAGRVGLYNTYDVAGSDTGGMQLDNVNASYAGAQPMQAAGVSAGYASAALTTQIQLVAAAVSRGIASASLDVQGAQLSGAGESSGFATCELTTQIALAASGESISSALVDLPTATTALLCNFPGANVDGALSSIVGANTDTPTIIIRVRSPEDSEWQQWLFGLTGVAYKTITVQILFTEKEDDPDAYLAGWQGPFWSPNRANTPNNWTNIPGWSQVAGDRMTFTVSPGAEDTIYLASVPPMTRETVAQLIAELLASHSDKIKDDLPSRVVAAIGPYICALSGTGTDENGRSVSNLPLTGFVIRDDSLGVPSQKRWIELWSGVHTGEWSGFVQLVGAIYEILNGVHSTALLTRFNFVVRPLMSPKGNELGFRRNEAAATYFNHADANREWADGDTTLATVVQWQNILDIDHGVNHKDRVVGFFDFHDGKWTSSKAWLYYRSTQPNAAAIAALVAAENADIGSASTTQAGTTTDYWFNYKNVPFAFTCECADEKSTVAETMAYGAALMRALKAADDAGYVPQIQAVSAHGSSSGFAFAELTTSIELSANARTDASSTAALMTAISLAADGESGSTAIAELLLEDLGFVCNGSSSGAAVASLSTSILLSASGISSSSSQAVLGDAPTAGQPPPRGRVALSIQRALEVGLEIQ